MRTILTFSTLHQVLAAEKTLRETDATKNSVRVTPTPPGLGSAICGMSLEILETQNKETIIALLDKSGLSPQGIYEV